jgi:hypothetical protein
LDLIGFFVGLDRRTVLNIGAIAFASITAVNAPFYSLKVGIGKCFRKSLWNSDPEV